jgi:hypothetical protein
LVIRVVQHALTVVAGERDRAVSGVVAGESSSMSVESLLTVGVLDLVVEIEEDIGE